MADEILTEKDTFSENKSDMADSAAAASEPRGDSQERFVIRPAPAADPFQLEDSIYAEDAIPYAEAVAREEAANKIQVSCAMICGNISLLSEEAIQKAADTYNLVIAGKGCAPGRSSRRVHYYDTIPTEEKFHQL